MEGTAVVKGYGVLMLAASELEVEATGSQDKEGAGMLCDFWKPASHHLPAARVRSLKTDSR